MKQFNLDLPYRAIKPDERKALPENKHITEMLLRSLVQIRYPQGMNGTEADLWADVMEEMAKATEENAGTSIIELEKSSVLFLLGVINWCRDNSKVPPLIASWVRTLLDGLEQCKKQDEPRVGVAGIGGGIG